MSLALFIADKIVRFRMKRRFRRTPDLLRLRAMMNEMGRRPPKAPRFIRVGVESLGGVKAERLSLEGADTSAAVLYLHGGGFVAGSPGSHRALTWRLAKGLGVPVFAVDYRLAPEHPFPAALEDVTAAYKALLERGVASSRIVVGGDSAGGNLTLTLALKLKALGLPQPGALFCLSPVTDMVESFPSRIANSERDAMFDARVFQTGITYYCPDTDVADPLISPYQGDLRGLPPTLFQCAEGEMLRDDSVRMAAKMRAASVPVTLEVWPDVFHVWQLAADLIPESREAVAHIIDFLKKRLALTA